MNALEQILTAGTLFVILMKVAPLLLAAIGGAFTQQGNILNIGLEGMMLIGAFTAISVGSAFDSALVGVNKAEGDIIDLRFVNKELNKVVVISEPKATMFPARQTTEQDKILRNFRWLEARRPKTRFELFGN